MPLNTYGSYRDNDYVPYLTPSGHFKVTREVDGKTKLDRFIVRNNHTGTKLGDYGDLNAAIASCDRHDRANSAERKAADRVDGFDRDDLGESPDY